MSIPSSGGLTVANGASVSGNSVCKHAVYQSPLGPGLYGAAPYSITIAVGPSGTLVITPSTSVTPAEWVAANQVVYTTGQTLNIGINNAANGGHFTIDTPNISCLLTMLWRQWLYQHSHTRHCRWYHHVHSHQRADSFIEQ